MFIIYVSEIVSIYKRYAVENGIYKIYDVENSIYSTYSSLYIKYIYAVESENSSTDNQRPVFGSREQYTTNQRPVFRLHDHVTVLY